MRTGQFRGNLCAREPTGGDASNALLKSRVMALDDRLRELESDVRDRLPVLLQMGHTLLELQRQNEAWKCGREAFDIAMTTPDYDAAVQACNLLYHSECKGAIAALGQGIWLAVTFPIDPQLTLTMLQNLVEETPDDSDGAAVAAATAQFVVDLRSEGKQHEDLSFFTARLLGGVAQRHSNISEQAAFDAWCARLELDNPDKFLLRLRNVVDVLVQQDWWFDRNALRATLPDI